MSASIEKWDFFELVLAHQFPGNPFIDVTLTAVFSLHSREVKITGFYDGKDVFKVRFMPDQEGEWRYVTRSNVTALDGQHGTFLCTAPTGNNHGPVGVANQFHFAYADGTPYKPVGTTCYVWNLQGDELEEQTLKTVEQAPFNKMRMCVFPKRYAFNQNEPPSYPFPGELPQERPTAANRLFQVVEPPQCWDFSRFNPVYFQHLEQRILDLRVRGIEADLIVFHP